MAREQVPCEIEEIEVTGDRGGLRPGVCARCTRCGHTTESYGTGRKSVLRCLVLMREECPEGEDNWYFTEDDEQ